VIAFGLDERTVAARQKKVGQHAQKTFSKLRFLLYTVVKMALLSEEEITRAFARLGELAQKQGTEIDLVVVGGAAMVLAYKARAATHDVDV
jgi:hypothetical protein